VAQYLSAEHGIGVRDGRFCAHPLLKRLTPPSVAPDGAAVRASVGLGSRAADVDRLVRARRAPRARPFLGLRGAGGRVRSRARPPRPAGLAGRPPGRPAVALRGLAWSAARCRDA
jgi:hypothetical protein